MAKISLFEGFTAKPHICKEVITLDDFLNGIKYGKWQQQVEAVRQEQNKEKRDALKRRLPTVTIGGVFKERKQDELLEHSGFICVDIDYFDDKTALLQDPYTYALFKSVGGGGLAVICKVNKDKHKESYNWLANYYYSTYGINVDPAPKNVASLRFVSFDAELFVNTRSLTAKTKAEKIQKPKTLPNILDSDEVGTLVNEVVKRGINIAPDYHSYLQLGFALANGFGENGRAYFHRLSSTSDKYNSVQADKQYNHCLKGANKSGVTVGTFYYMLKQAGIELPKKNERAVQLAAMAKKTGRTKEGIVTQLEQIEGLAKEKAEKIATEVFEREDIDLSKVASDPDKLIQSLIEWININHPIRMNSITRMIEENGMEVKKERLNTIYLRARMCFNSKEITKDLVESIIFSDIIHVFNPITEYIEKNSYRNSTGNISRLVSTIKTDTPNADIFIKKWVVSIIAAYDGYPVRSVLALVGGQNTGKTEWFRRLLPNNLRKYYAESKLDSGKDDEILMTQKLIVMDDEMGGKSKQDEKRFKELTSKQVFSLRAPYGRYNEDFKRLAILCGTSNDTNIINDPTGNTRILPINVLGINHEAYNEIDKDELFMEAFRLYQSGFEWQLTKQDLADLGEVSNDFEVIPFERELITEFFKHPKEGGFVEYLTSTQIKNTIESNSKQRIMNMKRFAQELRNVFGVPIQKKFNGIPQRVFGCIRVNANTYTAQNTDYDALPY